MNNTIGAVILSRFSSTRLPGKALREINGKAVLSYIVERALTVLDRGQLIIATSLEKSDDAIEAFAYQQGIACFRGSLDNVSRRFFDAAESKKWDYAIRINGDNIFLDVHVLSHMIQLTASGKYDFISNVKERTFPKGMSVEIVNVAHYRSLLPAIEESAQYREHVTLYLYEHDAGKNYRYVYNEDLKEAAGLQMALDTQEDFDRSRKIIDHFTGVHTAYNLKEIFEIYERMVKDGDFAK